MNTLTWSDESVGVQTFQTVGEGTGRGRVSKLWCERQTVFPPIRDRSLDLGGLHVQHDKY